MIFKIPKTRRERKPYKLGDWVVMANNKGKAEKDLRRYLGAKKFKREIK